MNDSHERASDRGPVGEGEDLEDPPISTARLKSLLDDLASFLAHVRERGIEYATEGRVGPLAITDARFGAEVRGTRVYRTGWHWDDGLWLPECTCPAGPYCKHAYAVACALLDAARREGVFGDRRLDRLVPADIPARSTGPTAIPTGSTSQPGAVTRDRRRGPARRSDPYGAAWRAEASLRSKRPATLRDLLKAATSWDREDVLERMLAGHGSRVVLYMPPFEGILDDPDPELMCFRLAQEIPRWTSGWLPPALEPYADRPDLEERLLERELPAAERELLRWADERGATPQRSVRMVLGLRHGGRDDVIVTTEVRLTSARMRDVPRTAHQVNQLHNELRRKPWLLPPDQAVLLHAAAEAQAHDFWGDEMNRAAASGLTRLLRRVAGNPSITWSADLPPDLAARAGVVPDSVVRLSEEPLRLLPACATDERGDPRLLLRVFWPEGRQRALDEVLYFPAAGASGEARPGLVLCDGFFHELIEEPPPELLARLRGRGGLPLRGELRARLLPRLAEAFPALRESLAGHVRHHAVNVAVALALRDDDWLQIRLFAHTGERSWQPGGPAEHLFEYGAEHRWERIESPARPARASRADAMEPIAPDAAVAPETVSPPEGENRAPEEEKTVWFEAPDPRRVAPAIEWLRSTGGRSGEQRGPGGAAPSGAGTEQGWWVKLNKRSTVALATAWAQRPADVDWFGNQAVRRLLEGGAVARARVRIKGHGVDWFTISSEWESEGRTLTSEDLARLRAATTPWVKLSSGWTRRDAVELHDQTAAILADLGVEAGEEERVTLWQLAAARPESLAALERLGADPESVRAVERLRERIAGFEGLPEIPVPSGFVGEMRPYQRRGLDFLAWTSSLGLGAVLADDMGLGKTIQALAWIQHLRERDPKRPPTLVVCPTSVMHNWAREAARFTPLLRVLVLPGGASRHELRHQVPEHDLIVTSYALLRRDLEAWRETRLDAVILDEAQNIKNPDTAIARAVRELEVPRRLALTGTPLENRALDLWSIMSFLNPGYLGDRAEFSRRYDRLDAPPHARTLLAAKLRPVLLRRLKRQVAPELPDRIEEQRDCELTEGQRKLYASKLVAVRDIIAAMSVDPKLLQKNKISILAELTKLRQICCHPALAGGDPALGSGKFDALFELLEPLLAEGHKVLLFSQFVRCLDLIAADMTMRGIPFHVLTGSTTKREEVVAAFTGDTRPCVFLISLKAGGTGLNLTAASYVVLFDPWWNPAVEAQAIDRTHRIGQDRTVIAYRMLAAGTIEERIAELQRKKAALVDDVLGEDGFARTLSRDDLEYLLADVSGPPMATAGEPG